MAPADISANVATGLPSPATKAIDTSAINASEPARPSIPSTKLNALMTVSVITAVPTNAAGPREMVPSQSGSPMSCKINPPPKAMIRTAANWTSVRMLTRTVTLSSSTPIATSKPPAGKI